ncbi:Triose-phosphate Transporter [Apophysomyces ossiformis]|uniref:Triose-phosphate Transporter n=1 Tax=Apophysomyces ossiformis TaxID=679940 RepID=A0A8H7ENI0_9FUNG|nr:Triose-phosphate Transporter [Apophysomyces ossiformis]
MNDKTSSLTKVRTSHDAHITDRVSSRSSNESEIRLLEDDPLSLHSDPTFQERGTSQRESMCKSSTLAFVLIFAFLFRLQKVSMKLITVIVIISSGVLLMVSDETEFVWAGFIQVMAASVCGGLRWSLTEVLLRKESMGLNNPFASIFFLAPLQALVLLLISAIVEGYVTIFWSSFFVSFSEGLYTISAVFAGGLLAFLMIMSEFFLIKRTSVVTLSVCGIFKEVATIGISSIVFGDRLTIINVIGLCITLFGIGLYNWMKMREAMQQAPKQPIDHELAKDEDEPLTAPKHLYSMVAESTPFLVVDGALTAYREEDDDDHDDNHKHDQYEMR